jgi:hypothetical protein
MTKLREPRRPANPEKLTTAEELTVRNGIDCEPENCNSKTFGQSGPSSKAAIPDDIVTQCLDDLCGLTETDLEENPGLLYPSVPRGREDNRREGRVGRN